jgi:hypothetical protein
VLIFVGMMAHAKTKNEIAPFGLKTTYETCSNTTSIPCPLDFDGFGAMWAQALSFLLCCSTTRVEGARRKTERNYLYGPTTSYLVSIGAKFTLCMRADTDSNVILAKQRATECGLGTNTCDDPLMYSGYSCCGLTSGRKGMMSEDEVLSVCVTI